MPRNPFDDLDREERRPERRPRERRREEPPPRSSHTGLILAIIAGALVIVVGLPIGFFVICAGVFSLSTTTTTQRASAPLATHAERPPEKPPVEPTLDWKKVGDTARVADVEVKVVWAAEAEVSGQQFGRVANYGPLAVVKLRFTNSSKTRKVDFGGWTGICKLTDELGNNYAPWRPGAGWAFNAIPARPRTTEPEANDIPENAITAGAFALHPEMTTARLLIFEKPVTAAREFRLTAPASELGGSGDLHFRVPRAVEK